MNQIFDKSNYRGFSLVEVLIAVVILSLAIMTLGAAMRQAFQWKYKQHAYEEMYITASSLLNEIVSSQVSERLEERSVGRGELNGSTYEWTCRPFLAANNFEFSSIDPNNSGNNGYFRVVLQQCSLSLEKDGMQRDVEFYRTQYCCPLDINEAP